MARMRHPSLPIWSPSQSHPLEHIVPKVVMMKRKHSGGYALYSAPSENCEASSEGRGQNPDSMDDKPILYSSQIFDLKLSARMVSHPLPQALQVQRSTFNPPAPLTLPRLALTYLSAFNLGPTLSDDLVYFSRNVATSPLPSARCLGNTMESTRANGIIGAALSGAEFSKMVLALSLRALHDSAALTMEENHEIFDKRFGDMRPKAILVPAAIHLISRRVILAVNYASPFVIRLSCPLSVTPILLTWHLLCIVGRAHVCVHQILEKCLYDPAHRLAPDVAYGPEPHTTRHTSPASPATQRVSVRVTMFGDNDDLSLRICLMLDAGRMVIYLMHTGCRRTLTRVLVDLEL
ncbi:hypothetical protein EDB89DRAFT_1905488 [Lactarius sanguifluus]|nr:hypothetical protein EDB89DRAFT_1905488 [Lactarius sanguifluus]